LTRRFLILTLKESHFSHFLIKRAVLTMTSSDPILTKLPALSAVSQKYITENEVNRGDIVCCPAGPNSYRVGLEEVLNWPDFLKNDFRV
jgi:hypothetical protein